jgi:transposase
MAYTDKKEVLQELQTLEKQGHIDLFYADESGFSLTPVTANAWQYKGEQIEILPQKSKRLNVFGLMSQGKRLTSFLKEGTIEASFVVNCIEEWMKTLQKPTVLVLDNAPVHQADLRTKLEEWQQKDLFIFFLPTYSPHLNQIEQLWRKVKYEWLKPEAYSSFNTLRAAIEDIFANFGEQYSIKFKEYIL